MIIFPLPRSISDLIKARDSVREHYRKILESRESNVELKFTLDGNLVGDIGEAIAVELFGVTLVETKSREGIDGYAPDGTTTIQIKATGTGRGPAFRKTETRADHFLFFDLDFAKGKVAVLYNGPEHYAVSYLPESFSGQRSLTRRQILSADSQVLSHERLPLSQQFTNNSA